MKDNQRTQQDLQVLCLEQKQTLIRQEVQIWDLEEEIRVLNHRIEDLLKEQDTLQEKIDKFELWCDHQQIIINTKDIEKLNAERVADGYRLQLEESTRFLKNQLEESTGFFKSQIENLERRNQELQGWADHLQGILDNQEAAAQANTQRLMKKYGIFYKIFRKIKSILSK